MAIYRPQELSTKLCYLFDSKRVTIEQFATFTGCSAAYIEVLTNRPGTRIDWATKHAVGKAISHFHRLFPDTRPPSEYEMAERHRQLELVRASNAESVEREGTPRGVFEDRDCFPGVRAFMVIDSTGRCLMRVEMAAPLATRAFEQRLVRWLNRVDPIESSITLT